MPVRVLYVDGDREYAASAAAHLEQEHGDFAVVREPNAEEGLDRLAASEFDCVVSARRLPGMDGLEFLDAVRDVDSTVPFLLFTAAGTESVAREAISKGATDCLRKGPGPDGYGHLAERVRSAATGWPANLEEIRARRAMETANEGISVLDDEGRFVYVNEAYADIYGYDPGDIVGEHWELLYFDEDYQTIREDVLPEVAEVGQWRGETRGKRKDGTTIVEDHSLAATEDGGLICTVRDVTDRKRRERRIEALHEATRTLMAAETRRDVAERLADAAKETLDYPFTVVRLLDDDGSLVPVAVSEEMQATMGGERPTYEIGEETAGLAYARGQTTVYDDVRTLDDEVDRGNVRGVMYLPIGEYGVVTIADRQPAAFDASDISLAETLMANTEAAIERIDRERELRRKKDRLEEFASIVSHDLRNPLNVADGWLELARQECESERLANVAGAHDRMAALIEDLLTLAREGDTVADPDPIDLAAVAEDCWRNVETGAAALVTDTERDVVADGARLQRLLENLLRNAVEHGATGDGTGADGAAERETGDLTVTVGDVENGFYVEDDGRGIPEAEREQVFEAGHSTTDDGTGLGLAIVTEIVDAHGWEVSVTDGDDGGARFEITGVEEEP